jgi:FtsZ-binding cell division protein ZapB
LTPEQFAKIKAYDDLQTTDAQQTIQRLQKELADCKEENKQLNDELDKYKKENVDLSRVLTQWVPNPFVLPCRAVKQELGN